MKMVHMAECFTSIQGESTWAGASCFFIRLAGCNLRCSYCDTPHAHRDGKEISIAALIRKAELSRASIIEITGGEPLLQPGFRPLAVALLQRTRRPVLVETNGSLDISIIPSGVIAIVDVKCPASSHGDSFDEANLARLRPHDEVKFVLSNAADYRWARAFVKKHDLASHCRAVLFSPVPGRLAPAHLGRWIVRDGLPVRLQVQLHKVAGMG